MIRILLVLACLFGCLSVTQAQQGITPCAAFSISASNTSANQQLSACGDTILLWNVGTQELFYNFGTASSTAATSSNWSLPGNSFVVISLGFNKYYLAAITSASTTTLRITQGITR